MHSCLHVIYVQFSLLLMLQNLLRFSKNYYSSYRKVSEVSRKRNHTYLEYIMDQFLADNQKNLPSS